MQMRLNKLAEATVYSREQYLRFIQVNAIDAELGDDTIVEIPSGGKMD